jgi:hypothetical protein
LPQRTRLLDSPAAEWNIRVPVGDVDARVPCGIGGVARNVSRAFAMPHQQ